MQPRGPIPAEEGAREALTDNARVRRFRRFWRTLPGHPRCKLCTAPLGGTVGGMLRLVGKGPWPGNPKYCRWCFKSLYSHRAGAEVECTLLFADVRGSTRMAESLAPRDFRLLMDRFYATAVADLIAHDAFVDKFVGDEVMGIFIPVMTEGAHARHAIAAGLQLLRSTGHQTDAPWVPVGIGVNSGVAHVGAVGTKEHVEFTALRDTVNVAARLASAAGAGELLVTEASTRAAELPEQGGERRSLELKGKSEPIEVRVLSP